MKGSSSGNIGLRKIMRKTDVTPCGPCKSYADVTAAAEIDMERRVACRTALEGKIPECASPFRTTFRSGDADMCPLPADRALRPGAATARQTGQGLAVYPRDRRAASDIATSRRLSSLMAVTTSNHFWFTVSG
jgi:hypothetical protein